MSGVYRVCAWESRSTDSRGAVSWEGYGRGLGKAGEADKENKTRCFYVTANLAYETKPQIARHALSEACLNSL